MTSTRRQFTFERVYRADISDVWSLWTTKEGIESWWGPDGFRVTVTRLDLRAGGSMDYVMAAIAAEQAAFLKQNGMKLESKHHIDFTEVTVNRRLAYTQYADFIPGVATYEVALSVDFEETRAGVRMVLTSDVMHDERWTKLAASGWDNELDRLGRALEAHSRSTKGTP